SFPYVLRQEVMTIPFIKSEGLGRRRKAVGRRQSRYASFSSLAHCRLPSASCRLPPAYRLLPPADCLLPTAFCLLPTARPVLKWLGLSGSTVRTAACSATYLYLRHLTDLWTSKSAMYVTVD